MIAFHWRFSKFYQLVSFYVYSPTERVQFAVVMLLNTSVIWIRRRKLQGDMVKCHQLEVEIGCVKTNRYLPVVLFQ